MSDTLGRAKFSLADGKIEIEGSEAFVSEQLLKLEPFIEKLFRGVPLKKVASAAEGKQGSTDQSSGKPSLDQYENLFADADGKIQILKDLPGAGKSQKTVSAALLLAYARHLQGVTSVSYDSVRTLCSAHACLDSGNFSKRIKEEKALFITTGSGSAQSITLTVPGLKKAKELAASMNNGS